MTSSIPQHESRMARLKSLSQSLQHLRVDLQSRAHIHHSDSDISKTHAIIQNIRDLLHEIVEIVGPLFISNYIFPSPIPPQSTPTPYLPSYSSYTKLRIPTLLYTKKIKKYPTPPLIFHATSTLRLRALPAMSCKPSPPASRHIQPVSGSRPAL